MHMCWVLIWGEEDLVCVLSIRSEWSCQCVWACEKCVANPRACEAVNKSKVLESIVLRELMDGGIEEIKVKYDDEKFSSDQGLLQMLQEKKFVDDLLSGSVILLENQ